MYGRLRVLSRHRLLKRLKPIHQRSPISLYAILVSLVSLVKRADQADRAG